MHKYLLLISIWVLAQSCSTLNPSQSRFDFDKVLWTSDWSPKGEWIAVGGNGKALQILDARDLRTHKSYELAGTVTQVKWHPTDAVIAVTSQLSEQPGILIRTDTDERIPLDQISQDGARGLGWNHDGSILGVGDNDGYLTLFNRQGDFIRKIDLAQKAITGLSWHPSKNILVAVGSQISIYDVDTDQLKTIQPREVGILMLCVAWHPSGEFFVTGDYGDYDKGYPPLLQFWTAEGENTQDIEESKAEYRNLRWSGDGKVLATASDKIRLWNTKGELIRSRSLGYLLWGIDWNPDNRKLVTTGENGVITILSDGLKVIERRE